MSWVIAIIFPADPMKWNFNKGMLQRGDDWFSDLSRYDDTFGFLHGRAFFTCAERFAYPGPTAVPYDLLIHTGSYRLAIYILIALWVGTVSALLFGRTLTRAGVSPMGATFFAATILLTSWPLTFLVERANMELVVICLAFAGAMAYWKGHLRTAAVFWGLAASMKIYPILLLALFLKRKQLLPLATGILTFALSLILSWAWIGPTISIAALGSLEGVTGFASKYAYQSRLRELNFDHSFLAGIKNPLAIDRYHVTAATMSNLGHAYVFFALASMCILYFTRVRHLPRFNQYTIFCIAMIAVPPVSYDYTLCHMYPAFGLTVLMFVRTQREHADYPVLNKLLWCFLILFTSQTIIFYQTFHPNGMFKAMALFAALLLLLRNPIEDSMVESALWPLRSRTSPSGANKAEWGALLTGSDARVLEVDG